MKRQPQHLNPLKTVFENFNIKAWRIFALGAMTFIASLPLYAKKTHSSINDSGWTLISTVDGVTISYALSSCQGQDKIYLKVVNGNAFDVTVNWNFWGESGAPKSIPLLREAAEQGDCNVNSKVELDEIIPEGKTIADLTASITVIQN